MSNGYDRVAVNRHVRETYTLGWNDNGLHPHLHVIPRFDDEPTAGQGVRSGIKDRASRRPGLWQPGTGRHMARP